MYDISRAHFHGVPVRRVFVELPDEVKERLAREKGPDQEYVGLLKSACMARWLRVLVGKRIARRS